MKIRTPSLPLLNRLRPLWRYRAILFFVLIAGVCAYLLVALNSAINVQASDDVETVTVKRTPRIEPALVQQLQNLQDNSVEVRSLFNAARENPFQ